MRRQVFTLVFVCVFWIGATTLRGTQVAEPIIETVFASLVSQPIALRGAGTIITADAVVPANAPDGSLLRMVIDMNDADRVNPAIVFDYALERRLAPSWLHMCGGHWSGVDAIDPDFELPYVPRCHVAVVTGVGDGQGGRTTRNKRGWRVRGSITLPQSIAMGWRIDVVTQQ